MKPFAAAFVASSAAAISIGLSAVAAAPRPVHQFLELAMAPDGAHLASVEGNSPLSGGYPVVRSLVIRNTKTGRAITVSLPCGHARQCAPSALAWSRHGKRLAFALQMSGSLDRTIYAVSADGKDLKKVLAFPGTVGSLRFGPGGGLAMLVVKGATKEVGATEPGAPQTGDLSGPTPEQRIAVYAHGRLQFVSPAGMWVYQYQWLPDGRGFVGTAAPGNGDDNWWIAKLYRFARSGGAPPRVIFSPPDPRHQIADPVVSPDGRTVAFISGLMSDFIATGGDVWTVGTNGGKGVDITPNMKASALSLGFDCQGRLRVLELRGAVHQIVDLDAAAPAATAKRVWYGADTIYGPEAGMAAACPSHLTATVRQSFTRAPEIAIGRAGHWHDLTHINAMLRTPLRARSVTWRNDGYDIQGWLLLPAHAPAGKLPLITVVHGGPAAASTPHFVEPGTMRALLKRGYAIFLPNPRGSFGQGESFTTANVRDLGHGDLRDILAGIDRVERIAPIDDRRLGIMGGSYGGFMTMWAVTQTNRFKAGVAAAGVSDWTSYYGENGIDQWMIPYFGASVYDDPKIYDRSSPIRFIKNVHTPVFAYVGADDIECPAPQTMEFWHALHDLGVPTSYAIYPGEGHGLRDPAHIADAKRRTLAWFARYLKK